MSGYLSLPFIEEKIRDLEYALFFSMSDAVLKTPTCVVKVLQTDQIGQLWFVIQQPSQFIHAIDKTFPVKLDFFRKGRNYYLKIQGIAYLVTDPEEINTVDCLGENIKEEARKNAMVIVRVKISHADYVEKAPVKSSARDVVKLVRNRVYNWFRQTQPFGEVGYQKIPAEVTYPSLSSFTN
jgi:hypothetical protein